ncbi:MAG: PP2C family protein-serine/threonine phosphatase [Vulcanimicrobiota bacterium]
MGETLTILIADDDPISRSLLLNSLSSEPNYHVLLAEDGQEAVELFMRHQPDIIISDWMMPRMDGPELLRHVREHTDIAQPFFLMLTVKWRAEDRVLGLDLGADDYLVKPFEADELRARIRAGLRVLNLKRDLQKTVQQLEQKAQLLEADLRSAEEAQRALLPSRLPELGSIRFDYTFLPCHYVSGDSLNIFRLTEDHIAFYMLDVCGHGVQAVMLSVGIHRILTPDMSLNTPLKKALSEPPHYRICSPSEVFEILNRDNHSGDASTFFTFFYGVLNHRTLELQYSRAGHLPPLLIKQNGQIRRLMEGGIPIGIRPEARWEEGRLQLEAGDRLLIYSDGVVEVRDPARQFFGLEGLESHLRQHLDRGVSELLKTIERRVHAFSQRPLRDDFSLMALEVTQ